MGGGALGAVAAQTVAATATWKDGATKSVP